MTCLGRCRASPAGLQLPQEWFANGSPAFASTDTRRIEGRRSRTSSSVFAPICSSNIAARSREVGDKEEGRRHEAALLVWT